MPEPTRLLSRELSQDYRPNRRTPAVTAKTIFVWRGQSSQARIAELIGYPVTCGGLLVSGGNTANFVCFLAARTAKAGWDIRKQGVL